MFTAIFNFFGAISKVISTSKEHQAETEVIKDSKSATKAIRAANRAFDMVEKSNGYLINRDMKNFKKLKKVFDNNI